MSDLNEQKPSMAFPAVFPAVMPNSSNEAVEAPVEPASPVVVGNTGTIQAPTPSKSPVEALDAVIDPVSPVVPAKPVVEPVSGRSKAIIDVAEWDDGSPDPAFGLGAEVDDVVVPKMGSRLVFSERDFVIIRFLARYRYAYLHQLARLVNADPSSLNTRLLKLEKQGFLRQDFVTKGQGLWFTRKAANLMADVSFAEIKKSQMSIVQIAHTVGLVNLAVELEREFPDSKNILKEDIFPIKNRIKGGFKDGSGELTFGEMTVSEREIRQGQLRWRGSQSTDDMSRIIYSAVNNPDAPELLEGNEGLFVIYGKGEHIPDLVVTRPRDSDGMPQHIAIELELTAKKAAEWKRILRWYKDSGVMFSKVYYFTHKRSIYNGILRVAEELDMQDMVVVRKYVPLDNNAPFWG